MSKPKFDSSKPFELAKNQKPAFNPNKSFEPASMAKSQISKAQSAARGGFQGATLGFMDEFSGGVEAAGQMVGIKGAGGQMSDMEMVRPNLNIRENYIQARDKARGLDQQAKKANPASYHSAEIGAGVGIAFVPGLNVAKGAKLLNVAGKSALYGGTAGAGYSGADTAAGVIKDAATGAAVGAVIPYALKGAGKVAGKAAKGAKGSAERFAARSLGAERGTIKKLGQQKVQEAGRQALDEGVVTPFASTDTMIARNAATKNRGGQYMDEAFSTIDDANASSFNPLNVATKVDDELGSFYRSPINKSETNQLNNTIDSILMRGEKNIPLKDAQILKREIGKVAYPGGKKALDPTPKQQMAMDAYKIVNQAIDQAADDGSKIIGSRGLKKKLVKGKALFGNAKTSEKLLENKLAREQGNQLMGLGDKFILGAGLPAAAVTGGSSVLPTLALYGGKKVLDKFGAQTAAVALDKTSKVLSVAPRVAETAAKSALSSRVGTKSFRTSARSGMPAAAEQESPPTPKGQEKWASDGFDKLKKHSKEFAKDKGAMLKNPQSKKLLIAASDLKPGSKAMDNILARIEKLEGSN